MMRKINLFAPINPTGYGIHAINFGANLIDFMDVYWYPIGNVQYNGEYKEKIESQIKISSHFYPNIPSICLWHQHDMARFHGTPRIGYTVFELDRLSPNEASHLQSCDYIWVTSKWARAIVLRDTNITEDRISVVPEGVDSNLFPYNPNPRPVGDRVKLLNIGKFEVRKGHLHILELLRNTKLQLDLVAHWSSFFTSRDAIVGTINQLGFSRTGMRHLDSDSLYPKIMCEVFSASNGNSIWFPVGFLQGDGATLELIKRCDIGLFPYCAEGWNLPLIECMSTGMPCIATNYSGPTEYLTNDNAILLEHNGLIPARDGRWFNGQGDWASITFKNLNDTVEAAISDKDRLTKIRQNLKDFGEQWSWRNSARIAKKLLMEL